MAESRIKNAFSRSTILTVGRLLAFIVAGFAVGLVIGVATEEPELLAGHLQGDTEMVELDEALAAGEGAGSGDASSGEPVAEFDASDASDASDALPDVAAAPDVWSDPEAVPGAVGAPAVSEDPIPSPASAAAGGWAIQVGAFGDAPSAEQLRERLEGKGYPVEVLPAGAESNRWRVRVQPIAEEKAARATAERIEREERLPIWVIRLEGQTRS